jgi:hypothetical protein
MIVSGGIDPLGFVISELASRGALIERSNGSAIAVLPAELAARIELPETIVLADATTDRTNGSTIACGLGSPLLDRLVTEVRASVPVASVAWQAVPARLAVAERLALRLVVRNGVADVLGAAHAPATYLAGVFAWTAEADDRYQGMAMAVVHAGSAGEPDAACLAAIGALLTGDDARVVDERHARGAAGAAHAIVKRVAIVIGPRLDEVDAAVARRRDRERARIDDYFGSLVAEARRPRRQALRAAIEAQIAALRAEHAAKLRDLGARYTLRVRIDPVALAAITTRVAEVRLRLRRRKGERELALQIPPGARAPDALACVACPAATRAPVLCDDALHVLCEACAPEVTGRPRCPACRPGGGAKG